MKQLQVGEFLDGFRIGEQLHKSAVATLYKAFDLIYNRPVVLKIPLDDIINNPVLIYHHQNETRISNLLDHPTIVRHLHRYKSNQYTVMEFIDGIDLRSLLSKKKKLGLNQANRIFCQIAEGCAYLHNKGILHLDLKPENIMITENNKVKIIDFGLSRQCDYDDLLSMDFSGPKGTAYYISPEQLCGFRDTKQSDIYGLGILFYEMLTGKLPFDKSHFTP